MRTLHTDRLRERVLAAMASGLALASGCSDRTIGDAGESSGVGSGSTTNDTSTTDGSPSPTVTASPPTSDDDGSDDSNAKFDLHSHETTTGPVPDLPPTIPPETCEDPGGEGFSCGTPDAPGDAFIYRCTEWPVGGCQHVDVGALLDAANECIGGYCGGPYFLDVACGPDPGVTDACCYRLLYKSEWSCPPGRPFTVGGSSRLASVTPREDWAVASTPNVGALSIADRAALADAWTECASFEHASVASFARFVLQLLAVGAPAELVARAEEAMREELEHARAMFGLASAYAGRVLGPGPLAIDGALANADDLATLAAATASEGCIAETISSLQIAIAAERATDPAVASMLRGIAEEELRHAELAWRFVTWSLARGDAQVRRAIADAFRHAERSIPRGPLATASLSPKTLHAHGLLTPHEHRALAHTALTTIILPAASRLLRVISRSATATR